MKKSEKYFGISKISVTFVFGKKEQRVLVKV